MILFKKFLLIFFSSLIFCVSLRSMEQENQIKIFILPYTIEDSKVFVLGGPEKSKPEWKTFGDTLPISKITDEIFNKAIASAINKAIASAILGKQKNIPEETLATIVSEILLKNLKPETAKILHQQTFGLFAQQENKLTNMLDLQNGIQYFLNKLNKKDTSYINKAYSLAIFFIQVPHIDCSTFNICRENVLKKLELPQYNKNVFSEYLKKDNFEWIEIDEIFNCKYDPDLTKCLKKPDIQKIITTLKMQAKQTSDGVQTKSIEFSDSDDDE